MEHHVAKVAGDLHELSGVPSCSMRPFCSTSTRSTSVSIDRRCAMMRVVRPSESTDRALLMDISVRKSRLAVASSRMRMVGSGDEGTRQQYPLTLSDRECHASLANQRVEAVRQALEHGVKPGEGCGLADIPLGRVQATVADVVGEASSQRSFHRPPRHAWLPEATTATLIDGLTVNGHLTALRTIQTDEQIRHRGLAGTGRADERGATRPAAAETRPRRAPSCPACSRN